MCRHGLACNRPKNASHGRTARASCMSELKGTTRFQIPAFATQERVDCIDHCLRPQFRSESFFATQRKAIDDSGTELAALLSPAAPSSDYFMSFPPLRLHQQISFYFPTYLTALENFDVGVLKPSIIPRNSSLKRFPVCV